MSNYTENLGLFKYDKSVNGEEKFSIQKALNENWDKIDAASKKSQFLTHNAQVYSEEEICIGAYLGKPLYRKVSPITLPDTADTWLSIVDCNSMNIDKCCMLQGFYINNSGNPNPIPYTSDILSVSVIFNPKTNNVIIKLTGTDDGQYSGLQTAFGASGYLTLEYTKTTDAEGSVVVNNSKKYSLEEQVVGEWFNGKPIYRKCFTGVAPAKVNETITLLDITDCNIDTPIRIEGMVGINGGALPLNFYFGSQSSVSTWFSNNTIQFRCMDSNLISLPINGYIEYTKTTDTAVES